MIMRHDACDPPHIYSEIFAEIFAEIFSEISAEIFAEIFTEIFTEIHVRSQKWEETTLPATAGVEGVGIVVATAKVPTPHPRP